MTDSGGAGGRRPRRADVGVACALALLGAGFLWELVLQHGVPVARDMQMFFIPQKHILWEAFQQHRIPLWTELFGTGAPFLANFQSGVFYPPHWIYAALPYFPAFNLLVVFHFVLGGAFTYALARRIELSRGASWAVAVAFMLGGYFTSLLNLINALQAAAWAPAMAFALLRHVDRRSVGSFMALVMIVTLALLAGEPQTFLMAAFVAGGLALLRTTSRGPARRRLTPLVASLVLAALAVAGLAMVQLLPTARLIAHSGRGAGLGYGEASFFALDPIRLIHLVIPTDYRDPVYRFGMKSLIGRSNPWLFSIYIGAFAGPLICFAWRLRERRAETVFWSGLFLLGIVLGLGDHTPAFRWAFHHVPGISAFRFPEKYFFLSGISAAFLSGYGLEALRSRRWARPDTAVAVGLLGLGLAVRLAWSSGKDGLRSYAASHFANPLLVAHFDFAYGVWSANLDKFLGLLFIGFVLVALYRRGVLTDAVFIILLLSTMTADFVVAHRNLNPVVGVSFYERSPRVTRYLPVDELRRDYRYRATGFDERAGVVQVARGVPLEAQKWLWQQTMQPNTGQILGLLQHDTWDAIKLRRYVDEIEFYHLLPEASRRWRLLRLNSVKYVYSVRSLESEGEAHEIEMDSLPGHLYEVDDPLPRAYVVERARYYADEVETINGVLELGFDPHREVALIGDASVPRRRPGTDDFDPGERSREAGALASALPSARIVSDVGEEVRIRVSVRRPAYLVLTDSYYPGWRATVDGEVRDILLANFFFRAVPVRPGDHEVVFRYRSHPFRMGSRISLATLLLLGIVSGAASLGRVRLRRIRRS
ncbi:MAG: YfhO family protein [Gemmatimonadota bacterium]